MIKYNGCDENGENCANRQKIKKCHVIYVIISNITMMSPKMSPKKWIL
jgi:hypothetical protein